MTDDIDLSILTDDQLVALARLVAVEACKRRYGVQHATKAAFLDEAEKAKISDLVTEAELAEARAIQRRRVEAEALAIAQRQARFEADATFVTVKLSEPPPPNPQEDAWRRRKLLGRMVRQSLGAGWTLTVWRTADGIDQRVYLDQGDQTNRYGGKLHPNAAYYATGTTDSKHAPRTMSVSKIPIALKPELIEITKAALALWKSVRIDCDEAALADVEDLPIPDEYTTANARRVAKGAAS